MIVRAVITAGGIVDGPFAQAIGTPVKALAPFGGGTLLDVALAACAGAGIADVAVVAGREVRRHLRGAGVRVIDADADGRVNVLRALDAWPGESFLYLASDLPFIDAAGVRHFIERSAGFAVTMALAGEGAYRERFPGAPAHAVTLRGERIVNGSAFLVAADTVPRARALATRLFAARKNLFALARLLGPSLCARFAIGRLGIVDIEAFGRRRLDAPVAAIRDCDPGLCYDVDTVLEYQYACSRRG